MLPCFRAREILGPLGPFRIEFLLLAAPTRCVVSYIPKRSQCKLDRLPGFQHHVVSFGCWVEGLEFAGEGSGIRIRLQSQVLPDR